MKLKTNKLIVSILGIYFFSLGVLAVVNVFILKDYPGLLWMCYFGLLFIGFGMLIRNSSFILSQLNILMIPLIVWNVDFFYRLITSKSFLGITDYFFMERTTLGDIITLQHIYLLPFAFYAIYLIGLKRNDAWKISFVEVIVAFFIGLLFTSASENVNCVFNPCLNVVNFSGLFYNFIWFVMFFSMILITNFLVVFIFRKRS